MLNEITVVFLICFLQICSPIYVFVLQRALLRYFLRKRHSKTYLRKLQTGSPLWAQLSGWYLLKKVGTEQKWLKPALILMNLNLVCIPFSIIFAVLQLFQVISLPLFYKIHALMFIKDALLTIILVLVCKVSN